MRRVPIRQKVHLPHDSSHVKRRKKRRCRPCSRGRRGPRGRPSHDRAAAPERLVVDGVSPRLAGRQPPDGPPSWTAFRLRPPGTPPRAPPRSRGSWPHGHLDEAAVADLPGEGEDLRPLLDSVPIAAKASGPWRRIHGTHASVSTLLITVGRPRTPAPRGRAAAAAACPAGPRARRRGPSPPRTRSPGPLAHLEAATAGGRRALSPEEAALLGLADGLADRRTARDTRRGRRRSPPRRRLRRRPGPAPRRRGGGRTRGPAVHEGAGVALVAVGDHVPRRRLAAAPGPLAPGGEAGAAAAPQPRRRDPLDDLVRRQVRGGRAQRLVGAEREASSRLDGSSGRSSRGRRGAPSRSRRDAPGVAGGPVAPERVGQPAQPVESRRGRRWRRTMAGTASGVTWV